MDMAVISKEAPGLVKRVSWEKYCETKDDYAQHQAVYTWEDLERFAYKHDAEISKSLERPSPVKSLYVGYHECDEGVDNFDFVLRAHSKAEVIEWLRRPGSDHDWWDRFKSQVGNPHLDYLHPFDVLDLIDETNIDGDSEFAFRIVELRDEHITDICTADGKRRKLGCQTKQDHM